MGDHADDAMDEDMFVAYAVRAKQAVGQLPTVPLKRKTLEEEAAELGITPERFRKRHGMTSAEVCDALSAQLRGTGAP